MNTARLEQLKQEIDAAIRSATPEAAARLAAQMEQALRELNGGRALADRDHAETTRAIQRVKDTLDQMTEPPAALPGDAGQQALLADLLADLRATQRFALALADGDLSQSLAVRGAMAGSLKSLQANLRHLTWQTEMIARGDFSQKVDFMGEFSTAFNTMVASLAAAREQIFEQNQALERVNASLRAEISGRRRADARAEIQHRLIEQREQERLQIARDLHDGPLQEMIAVVYELDDLALDHPDPALNGSLLSLAATMRRLIAEIREFAGELRPPALAAFGLKQAISSHSANLQKKYPGLDIRLAVEGENGMLPEATRLALFRIYQESLNNIIKHAGASQVNIRLHEDASVVSLQIMDNGRGFSTPEDWLELARNGHLGLVGIRERVDAIRGQVEIRSQPGQGTSIRVTAPVQIPDPSERG